VPGIRRRYGLVDEREALRAVPVVVERRGLVEETQSTRILKYVVLRTTDPAVGIFHDLGVAALNVFVGGPEPADDPTLSMTAVLPLEGPSMCLPDADGRASRRRLSSLRESDL
jgi:hypothetical protein